jgi:hypothetical protein
MRYLGRIIVFSLFFRGLFSFMAKSIKGITRIDYEGVATKGWMVRLTRGGKRQQEFLTTKPMVERLSRWLLPKLGMLNG